MKLDAIKSDNFQRKFSYARKFILASIMFSLETSNVKKNLIEKVATLQFEEPYHIAFQLGKLTEKALRYQFPPQ